MAVDPARYWDDESADDKAYLPTAQRTWKELERVAAEVEADVIRAFTRDVGGPYGALHLPPMVAYGSAFAVEEFVKVNDRQGVYLRHFKKSAADVATAAGGSPLRLEQDAFLVAMKRTIALVIQWRFLSEQKDPQADMESANGKVITKARNHQEPYPPNWKRWLKPYITLEPPGACRI